MSVNDTTGDLRNGLGFFNGSCMVIGLPHRGRNFANLNQLLIMLLQVGFVLRLSAFPLIAAAHRDGADAAQPFAR